MKVIIELDRVRHLAVKDDPQEFYCTDDRCSLHEYCADLMASVCPCLIVMDEGEFHFEFETEEEENKTYYPYGLH